MTPARRRFYWRLTYGSAFVLSVLSFTPLVIPSGVHAPTVLGLPYTLWTGILITVALVVLTFAAGQVYPPETSDTEPTTRTTTGTDS